jgi:alpha-D-ribose 1-methylphosphonate 5-triphosphate diphosphatase PhnM
VIQYYINLSISNYYKDTIVKLIKIKDHFIAHENFNSNLYIVIKNKKYNLYEEDLSSEKVST